MPKDDYFYIVYQILSRLYACLKAGRRINPEDLSAKTTAYAIHESYWIYIMKNLIREGYIDGVSAYESDDTTQIAFLESAQITPKGIQYLQENSGIQKVIKALKTVKEITPGT